MVIAKAEDTCPEVNPLDGAPSWPNVVPEVTADGSMDCEVVLDPEVVEDCVVELLDPPTPDALLAEGPPPNEEATFVDVDCDFGLEGKTIARRTMTATSVSPPERNHQRNLNHTDGFTGFQVELSTTSTFIRWSVS